tara:strand:- start:509 stop:631 length:123 start_codon:yes stop_codon:yes gene_type:complete
MIEVIFYSVIIIIIVLTWLTERDWSKKKRLKWNKRKKRYE